MCARLYCVFDDPERLTGFHHRVLEFPSFGLQYLLKHYCDVTTDKKYQTADWRERPLSAEMLLYARQVC